MPTGQVVGLPSGAIVELDRDAEDAVDLYVDGQRYATGRLVVTDDDSWGVRIEHVLGRPLSPSSVRWTPLQVPARGADEPGR